MLSIQDLRSEGTTDPDENNRKPRPAAKDQASRTDYTRPTSNAMAPQKLIRMRATGNLPKETLKEAAKELPKKKEESSKMAEPTPAQTAKTVEAIPTAQPPKVEPNPVREARTGTDKLKNIASPALNDDPFSIIKPTFNLEGTMPDYRAEPNGNKHYTGPEAVSEPGGKNNADRLASLLLMASASSADNQPRYSPPTESSSQQVRNILSKDTNPAVIPPTRPAPKSKRPQSIPSENSLEYQFHRLIQQLEFQPSLERPLIIGITSTLRGEGRTTVALGMATALAQQIPLPIVLMEADLERPSLANDLGLPNRGLAEYLEDYLTLDDLAYSTSLPDLHVIVAGECDVPAMQALRSERLGSLIKLLSQQAAAIVVDLPPMASTGEAARLISQLDLVLMVVEAGSTPSKLIKSALELIPVEKQLGVLLNRTKPAFGFMHRFKGKLR
jgi:Mrp family chromosome partitioning ATPase